MRLGRLGDNDKRWGNWTFSKKDKRSDGRKDPFFCYFHIESVVDEDEIHQKPINDITCTTISFHLSWFGSIRYVIRKPLIKPILLKVHAKSWSQETIDRLGRDFYYEVVNRKYGFTLTKTTMHLELGSSAGYSDHEVGKTYIIDYPWTLDHVKTTNFNANDFTPTLERREGVYRANYLIQDYDGEYLVVSAYKFRLSYYRCKGIFKWFRYLLPLKHFWSTDLHFSKETGREKGSWKGGTIGTSVNTTENESISDAVTRYCDEHGMKCIGFIGFLKGELTDDTIQKAVDKYLPKYTNLLNSTKQEV